MSTPSGDSVRAEIKEVPSQLLRLPDSHESLSQTQEET